MTIIEKIRQISERGADGLTHLYGDAILGLCSVAFDNAGVPRENPIPEEYFDAVIDGLYDSFYGGCEPEDDDEERCSKRLATLEKLKTAKWIVNPKKSPYLDKTIPFLGFE